MSGCATWRARRFSRFCPRMTGELACCPFTPADRSAFPDPGAGRREWSAAGRRPCRRQCQASLAAPGSRRPQAASPGSRPEYSKYSSENTLLLRPTLKRRRRMFYESDPQNPRHRGASCHMVNGKLRFMSKSCGFAALSAQGVAGLLVGAAGDGDRRLGLGSAAFKVEAAIAHLDIVAAQQPHPFDAARGASQGVVLRQGEDDRRSTSDEVEEAGFWIAAIRLGIEFVLVVAAGTAERELLGLRVRQIDDVGGGDADLKAVDLVLELACNIVAAVGARRARRSLRPCASGGQ